MQSYKYKVSRSNVYVGKLGIGDIVYWCSKNIVINNWKQLRYILFSVVLDGGEDLLYGSPSYPVFGISDNSLFDSNCVLIQDAYNLGLLLKYYGYSSILGIDELIEIRKQFFTGTFVKDHCQDFGYREAKAENMKFYYNGQLVTGDELDKQKKDFIAKQRLGKRIFVLEDKTKISDYFELLSECNDEQYVDCGFPCLTKKDGFKPHVSEGPIKKLKKF